MPGAKTVHLYATVRDVGATVPYRSHALRGNAARDAPRPMPKPNAERPLRHYHAERGNDRYQGICMLSEEATEGGAGVKKQPWRLFFWINTVPLWERACSRMRFSI